MTPTPPDAPDLARLQLIADSYQRLTGRALVDAAGDVRAALWAAPAVIVAHGMQPDPVFFYGNQRALAMFDMAFEHFTRLPSRFSAEPMERAQRARLLARVQLDGFVDDYAGVRISATGQRFAIEGAVVWNLIDQHGICHGQAATFNRITPLAR